MTWVRWEQRPENVEHEKRRVREYYLKNKANHIARRLRRKRGLNQASMSRLFAPKVEEFYKEARRLTEETGVLHVVDHYWPINGKGSCGLHVPWNLRVITGSDNDSKGNKEPEDHWSLVLEELKENRNA
jgi:hypothetical protein